MFKDNSRKKVFILTGLASLIPLLFCLGEKNSTIIKVYLTTILMNFISALFIRKKQTCIITFLLCFLLSVSVVTSLYFKLEFKTYFSASMAAVFINTSRKELIDMLLYNYKYLWVWLFTFSSYLLLSYYLSRKIPEKTLRTSGKLLIVYFFITVFLYYVSGKTREVDFLITERLLINSPLYNLAPVFRAYDESRMIDGIIHNKNTFNYQKRDTEIDNYVVVIGESARRKDWSLYGSEIDTSPFMNAHKADMMRFTHAISPAPVTILSVPASLVKVDMGERIPLTAYSDNVITLANSLSMDTYWFSNQGRSVGKHDGLISAIALHAGKTKWNDDIIFDDSQVKEMSDVIKKPGKKFIILHFYGSHEPACKRYPQELSRYLSHDIHDNCYFNSLAYTDKLLGNIFSLLADTRSSVIYFSDHGLIRDPKKKFENYYHHGVSYPKKEAYDIPLLIWYSKNVTGIINRGTDFSRDYSTSNNYWLISDWLGVKHADNRRCRSPLSDCYQSESVMQVMDGNKKIMDYRTLGSEDER